MRGLRSVVVLALLWVGAVAASSSPDGVGTGPRSVHIVVGGVLAQPGRPMGSSDPIPTGKRWVVRVESTGQAPS